MRKIKHLDIHRLGELFVYDPESGNLTRKIDRPGSPAGTIVGTKCTSGHLNVGVDGKMIGVHRIAWALHHEESPNLEIDHINDNRGEYYITHFHCFGQAVKHANEMQTKLHLEFARSA